MGWFNLWGFGIIVVIMVPNVIFALRCREGFVNKYQNPVVEVCEQVGRFGSFGFMIINVPGTVLGWWFPGGEAVYLVVNAVLVALYCIIWMFFFNKDCIFRALSLSIIPTIIFLFSGIVTGSILLTIAAIIFGTCHILISYKNATM